MGARSVSVRKENQLWQWHCRNREIFFFLAIVAMPLLKMVGKKKVVAEITCEELKKKVLCLQYFYNIFTTNHR